MKFAFSEEQEFLRETARRFLADKAPMDKVRQAMASDHGYDPATWAEIASLGWPAMAIPEAYGGAGFTFLEVVVLMEEMGRAVLPAPFLSTVVMSANAVLMAGNEEQKQSILPAIASGDAVVTIAMTEATGRWDADGLTMVAKQDGQDWILAGTKSFVLDGYIADVLLVVARAEPGADGLTIFMVPGDAEGVVTVAQDAMDQTRPMADVTFSDVRVGSDAVLGTVGGGWPIIEKVLQLAAVALAAEQVGGAQKVLETAVEYAKVRKQFGRPIGSFQAIKHKCADMLVSVESARSAAYYAAWAAAEESDELPVVAALAKSYCSEAYYKAAADNIQIHGGIGFTWEHDAHLYFKRAKSSELMFGDPSYHRAKLADLIGL